MILLAVLTVFVAGLMVGRTPEYLGKKIERREITYVVLAALVPTVSILIPTAIALIRDSRRRQRRTARVQRDPVRIHLGLGEQRQRSMGGLSIANDFYNWSTAIVMLIGRFGTMVLALGVAAHSCASRAIPRRPEY